MRCTRLGVTAIINNTRLRVVNYCHLLTVIIAVRLLKSAAAVFVATQQMENFVVSEAAVKVSERKRITHPPERIEQAVGLARQVGPLAAASTITRSLMDIEISADTLLVGAMEGGGQFLGTRWKTRPTFVGGLCPRRHRRI